MSEAIRVQEVTVTQRVEVTVDETKFTDEFMAEFRQNMYPFDTIQDHILHLAQLYARGITDDFPGDFIEGYGRPAEFGIKFRTVGMDVEIGS